MFSPFFLNRKWFFWSWVGGAFILFSTWYQVQLDVEITEWFRTFYDTLQKALSTPNSVTFDEFLVFLIEFAKIAGLWIVIMIITNFFVSHWVFRWRTAMTNRYQSLWDKVNHIEGAAQRVQEDTLKFARIMETLGVGLLDSIMTLVAFVPLLWTLSKQINELPWIGAVSHGLVWVAILAALGGTLILAIVGIKLPGIEFNIQKEEAAYRKELVLGEDDENRAKFNILEDLYYQVQKIHFKSYFHYLYFNACKWSYFQGMVIVPYIALAPTIVAGVVTLGFVQQIVRVFGRVESSLQYLVRSWSTIVELISVFKRLQAFERAITPEIETSKI